jgi:hypothetical protein
MRISQIVASQQTGAMMGEIPSRVAVSYVIPAYI